jgi:hypothetical protein
VYFVVIAAFLRWVLAVQPRPSSNSWIQVTPALAS